MADRARTPRLRRDRAPGAACDIPPPCRSRRIGLTPGINSIELVASPNVVNFPPNPRRRSSRHVAGDPTSVRAPDRSKGHRPHKPPTRRCTPQRCPLGSVTTPGKGTAPTGRNTYSRDPLRSHPTGVPRRWHRRYLTGAPTITGALRPSAIKCEPISTGHSRAAHRIPSRLACRQILFQNLVFNEKDGRRWWRYQYLSLAVVRSVMHRTRRTCQEHIFE